MNTTGIAAALAAFLGVWAGHVSVRKIEYHAASLWLPCVAALGLGLGLEALSLFAPNPPLSAVFGILGITVLWDALELIRQQRRVRKGHAPANPANPRHARFLAEGKATRLDLLRREPVGYPVGPSEAARLVMERRKA